MSVITFGKVQNCALIHLVKCCKISKYNCELKIQQPKNTVVYMFTICLIIHFIAQNKISKVDKITRFFGSRPLASFTGQPLCTECGTADSVCTRNFTDPAILYGDMLPLGGRQMTAK